MTWHYANVNYVLLGALIETVSGEPYDRFAGRGSLDTSVKW